jgi:hypothetical protein
MSGWFEVSRAGLAKLIEKRGIARILYELVQNSWDTDATLIDIRLLPIAGKPLAEIVVTDDSTTGFSDLSHAFTLFAESERKADPTKRGRFCLGEKLFLALCVEATITSTSGTITFDGNGARTKSRTRTERGSTIRAIMRLTREQMAEVERGIGLLVPPPGTRTTFNGLELQPRSSLRTFKAEGLMTDVVDDEGYLVRRHRTCTVEMIEPGPDEAPMLYELGIPVVELDGGERHHLNVGQKVPLNQQRDGVPAAFLSALRVAMLNDAHHLLTHEDAKQPWARAAASDTRCSSDAIQSSIKQRFGGRVVSFDVSDGEANGRAVAAGYTVLTGGSLSSGEWANAKAAGIVKPAGKVTPSPKPLAEMGEGGPPLRVVPLENWTEGMRRIVALTERIGRALLNEAVKVTIVSDARMITTAMYSRTPPELTFNLLRLGRAWFEKEPTDEDVVYLILHELAHHYESDHLSDAFHDACCRLGARLALVVRRTDIYEV